MRFYAQAEQDRFILDTFFRGKRNGVYVDVGAYDGEKFSNTLFFERFMGWRGICVEPLPQAFVKLKATRLATCEQVCVADFEGEAEFVECADGDDAMMLSGLAKSFDPRHVARIDAVAASRESRRVKVRRLSSLLAEHRLFHVDYCSIDAGGAEFSILSGLDPSRFHISVFSVADNFRDDRIPRLMADQGYHFVERVGDDLVFKRNDVKRLPATSIICAMWNGDPRRAELLRGHAANLRRQTVPVEPIYVFDGGDSVPDWLDARAVSVRERLTIYQAWNVGLSLVNTVFVMNLNLDDRLAPDAIERLESFLRKEDAWAVGGDWKICYSQDDTDAVVPCHGVQDERLYTVWPPPTGAAARMGSGTGESGTYGPAVMWRLDAHVGAPRYPWRLADGTPIRKFGDVAWWMLLRQHLHKKLARMPMIIGNYHSHPKDQAEFRELPYDERRLLSEVGVSLM